MKAVVRVLLVLLCVSFNVHTVYAEAPEKSILNQMPAILAAAVSISTYTDCSSQTSIPPSECQSLVDFYDSTDGDGWTNKTGWKVNSDPCAWNGITCSGENVSKILLGGNNLNGTIPDSIGNLTKLTILNLNNNSQLTGSIPNTISSLTSLTELKIYYSNLTGSLPNTIGSLLNLVKLVLHGNQISGTIPSSIGNLINLTSLHLAENQLSGLIPSSIGNLVKLNWVSFDSNMLCGEIPGSVINLVNLADYNGYSGGFGINYNDLYTNDSNLLTFLAIKSGDWASTQINICP